MPARGAFLGKRLEFLIERVPRYINAVKDGIARDTGMEIMREYFMMFDLDDSIDPSEEHISAVDFSTPSAVIEVPEPEDYAGIAEFEAAMEVWEDKQHRIVAKQAVSRLITTER